MRRLLAILLSRAVVLVDTDGTLQNQIDNKLIEYAHQQGKKVWALFANQGFSKDIAHGVLIDPAKRSKVVKEVTGISLLYQRKIKEE